SSSSRRSSVATILSKSSHDLAALPLPPYTMSSSGFSATSGSRLFISIRLAASWIQPLAVRFPPRGALTVRLPLMVAPFESLASCVTGAATAPPRPLVVVCQVTSHHGPGNSPAPAGGRPTPHRLSGFPAAFPTTPGTCSLATLLERT